MAFLEINELDTVSVAEVRHMITDANDDLITQIIAESIDLMKGYLRNHYDADAVFEAEGDDRSLTVVKYLKDIVIYEMYIRQTHEQVNLVAKERYDEAMLWLEKVARGTVNLNLPKPIGDDGEPQAGYLWLTSRKRYSNNY